MITTSVDDGFTRLLNRETVAKVNEIHEAIEELPSTIYAELSEGEIESLAEVVADRLEGLFDQRFGEIERQLQSIVDSLPER